METVEAMLGYKMQVARGDVHAFLASALEGQELPDDLAGVVGEVQAALDTAEKSGKGWGEFTKKIQVHCNLSLSLACPRSLFESLMAGHLVLSGNCQASLHYLCCWSGSTSW